jgi:hypothetical protein
MGTAQPSETVRILMEGTQGERAALFVYWILDLFIEEEDGM